MTTQEKIDALTPFQEENFIICDIEYDYSLCVRIWQRITLDQWTKGVALPPDDERVEVNAVTEGVVSDDRMILVQYAIFAREGAEGVTLDDLLDEALIIVNEFKGRG